MREDQRKTDFPEVDVVQRGNRVIRISQHPDCSAGDASGIAPQQPIAIDIGLIQQRTHHHSLLANRQSPTANHFSTKN